MPVCEVLHTLLDQLIVHSLLAFRRAGLTATAAPVAIDAKPSLRVTAFVPLARSWLESYYATHELIGWAWYAIRP